MVARPTSEAKRIRYLLGLSPQGEREHIESEYFENEDAFQEMLTAEDDLIDAYAHGELVGQEQRAFEKHLVSSLREQNRVQFARALAGTASATQSVETKLPDTLVNLIRSFQSPGLFRAVTIAAVIVFVALLAWLLVDRRRITVEFRELRAESAKLGKRIEALQRSNDAERTRTAEIAALPRDLRAQPKKSRPPENVRTAPQRMRDVPEVKSEREKVASSKPELVVDKPISTHEGTLGNTFQSIRITELPIMGRDVANLLSLQPASTRENVVAGSRADQTNVTLDAMDTLLVGPPFIFSLTPSNTSSSAETTLRIHSLTWIRFQLELKTASIHEDYRITLETTDGRPVTSVDWSEPLTPNQTIIDTPAISTDDLTSSSYVLVLMGKEPDGSFVKVAEYSFKVIRY